MPGDCRVSGRQHPRNPLRLARCRPSRRPRGEADEAKRKQMYGDMQVLVHANGGVGIPVFISLIDAYDKRLKGYGSIPIGGLMGYSFADNVWLDA
jgi:peptide/nickel transport system substrate-binding protein